MKREYPHTPLPWRRSGGCIMDAGRNLIATRYSWTIVNEEGMIHNVREDGGDVAGTISPCEADSNAALMDIACNYHDQLIEAAETVTNSVTVNGVYDSVETERIEVSYKAWLDMIHLLTEIKEAIKAGDA